MGTMIRALLASTLILTAVPGTTAAQQLTPRPVPTRDIVSFTYQSPSMGVRFGINVGLPVGTGQTPGMPEEFKPVPGKKYQALITTDGDQSFPSVYDPARSLMSAKAIDDLYVISIGSELDRGDQDWTRRRIYEFSPPNWDMKDPFGQLVSKFCESIQSAPGKCAGGAPKFLNAIVTEMLPLLIQKYPIDPEQLGLFGISAGGFFASWTIFQPNSPFKKYIISSPAMAYGGDEIFRIEEKYAAEHKDLKAGIYMAAGQLEIQSMFLEGIGHITSGMTHLAGTLKGRNYPGLTLTTEFHPGMSHTDVVYTSVVRGLRTLYATGRPEAF